MPIAPVEVLEAAGLESCAGPARGVALGAALDERLFVQMLGPVYDEVRDFKRTRMAWPRLAQLAALARAVARLGVPGDYAEFGTWRGGSLYLVAETWRRLEQNRDLIAFDSFAGLPPTAARDGAALHQGQFADVDVNEVRAFFASRGLSRVHLVQGWFQQTIGALSGRTLALAHIDCDTHDSTVAVLGRVWEALAPGGFLVVDDYAHPDCPGVTVAVEEFFARREEVVWQTPMPESAAAPGLNCSCWVRKRGGRDANEAARAVGAAHDPGTLRARLVELTAQVCAARGLRRIALYGAGRHTESILPGPWPAAGVQVVAILDDHAAASRPHVAGVPIVRPEALPVPVDAVVVSSDRFEDVIAARAAAVFGPRGVPVLKLYGR
jgi:hypothetical protein